MHTAVRTIPKAIPKDMNNKKRSVLVIGVSPDEFNRVAPFLARDVFEVDRFPSAASALELTKQIPFDVLLIRFPLPGMLLVKFLTEVRQSDSSSARASVVVLAESGQAVTAQKYVGNGADRVVPLEEAQAKIHDVLSELLDLAPRKAVRIAAKLAIEIGDAKEMLICQTVNISMSGMLIKTAKQYEPGTQLDFQFSIPDERWPIIGKAEIMRQAQGGSIGVRFVSWQGDSHFRFKDWLNTL